MTRKGKDGYPLLMYEVKTCSPFGGWRSAYSRQELISLALAKGEILSWHTDPRYGGSFESLAEIVPQAKRRGVVVMAKGSHQQPGEIRRALDCGATWVLVVGVIPDVAADVLKRCILEPKSYAQLIEWRDKLPQSQWLLWNSRDLKTGGLKAEPYDQARAAWPGFLAQASNIHSTADVHPDADGILVGSYLPEFVESLRRDGWPTIARK